MKVCVTLPDGQIATRKTDHNYTHAVAVFSRSWDGKGWAQVETWWTLSYHHSEAAAIKKAQITKGRNAAWRVEVLPVFVFQPLS